MSIARQHRRRLSRASSVELVEKRVLFAAITVNTVSDNTTADSLMSIREAVELMNAGGDAGASLTRSLEPGEAAQVDTSAEAFGTNDRIVFDESIAGGTITLLSSLGANGTLTIDGGGDMMNLVGGVSQATFRAIETGGSADLTLDRLRIANFGQNSGSGDEYGGAIFVNSGGTLTVDRCVFVNNAAVGGVGGMYGGHGRGGAIYTDNATLTVTNSTFVNNSADGGTGNMMDGYGQGGAVHVNGGAATFRNSTFTQNSALGVDGVGGAVFIAGAAVTLDFVTMSDNTVGSSLATSVWNQSSSAPMSITNSILGQSDNTKTDLESSTSSKSGSYNLIRNTNVTGIGVISTADPLLGTLADNGGPTPTMKPQVGSPVIDVGPTVVSTSDQRGRSRLVGAAADLGALEVMLHSLITGDSGATFTAGQPGSYTFTTETDGVTPSLNLVSVTPGGMPAGLSFIDNGDGTATLSGTPAPGTGRTYSVQVTSSNGQPQDGETNLLLEINEAPGINVAATPSGFVGTPLDLNITTTGYPESLITLGGDPLPAGLTFLPSGTGFGEITGTPAPGTNGVYNLVVTADNGINPAAQANVTLTISDPPPQQIAPGVTVAPTASVEVGTAFNIDVTSTGFPTPTLSVVGTLPTGVTFTDLGDGTGVFTGTPATDSAGTYNLTVTASNGVNPDATGSLVLTIADPEPTPPPTLIVEEQTLGSSGDGKRIEDIGLSFGKALATTPPMSAFSLFGRDNGRQPANRRSLAIRSVAYDAATQSVSVQPVKSLRNNRFYSLNVDSSAVEAEGGGTLDGAGDGTPGSNFQFRFGRGKKLTYQDADGDRVTLRLRGPGVIELTRNADGEGLALKVTGATAETRLTGNVVRTRAGGHGTTTFTSLTGLEDEGGVNELDPEEFGVLG